MKKNRLFILFILFLISFIKINVYAENEYRVLFDQNYGKGLQCEGFHTYVQDGVCAGYVKAGEKISFPSTSSTMYRIGQGFLIGWTKTLDSQNKPECGDSNSIYSYKKEYEVNGKVDFYACYESIINGYRYTGENASSDGQNLDCGVAIYVTKCSKDSDGQEYCVYTKVGEENKSGAVKRNEIKATEKSAKEACEKAGITTINDYRYATTEAKIETSIECGAKLYITTCKNSVCNFNKVQNPDGTSFDYEGTVKENYIYKKESDATKKCPKKVEEIKNCENATQPNIKGDHSFDLCYQKEMTDKEVAKMIKDKEIVVCGRGYEFDETAVRASGDVECNSKYCTRQFTVNCMKSSTKKQGGISVTVTPANVSSNGQGTVEIFAKSTNGTIEEYYYSSEYIKPTQTSNWKKTNGENFAVTMSPGIQFLWVKDSDGVISNTTSISVLDTVNEDTTIKTLKLYDKNNKLTTPNRVSYVSGSTIKYQKLSNNLNKEIIAQGFNPFDSRYELEVSSPTITVHAEKTSQDASFVPGYGPRTVNLKYGMNTILIKIINKEGKERTYTILVTRTDDRNSDNTLNELTTSVGKLEFNSNVTDYKVEIPKNTKLINVNAKINSNKASYIEGYEPGSVEITGDTTVKLIKVKSETGSTRTYVITFIKQGSDEIKDESLQLSGLTIPGVYVPFEDNVSNYNITVGYTNNIIDIYAPLKDKNSSITIRVKKKNDADYQIVSNIGMLLDEGENYVEIKVTNNENKTSYYRLTIIRKEFGLEVSNDTSLKDLRVLGHTIDFKPEKKEYSLKIKTEKTLVITAVPTSNRAEVFIRGNEGLTAFSTVRIKVVAENGKYETYSIDIKKDAFNKDIEIISIIAGAVIIIISSCIIVIKKKKKAKREYFEE